MAIEKKQIFISYNSKDREVAIRISHALESPNLAIWIDIKRIEPGERISDRILEGLSASDYYIVLISESSNKSEWVRRELSLAFELSAGNKLTIIPILLDDAEVPLELKGLLYIDFRRSLANGLRELTTFFAAQFSKISELEHTTSLLKSDNDAVRRRLACEDGLRDLRLGDLRHRMTDKLSRTEVETIWFDVFERKMSDEAPHADISMSCVELIDRARRRNLLYELIVAICRSYPHVAI